MLIPQYELTTYRIDLYTNVWHGQETEVPVYFLDRFQELAPATHMSATCYDYLYLAGGGFRHLYEALKLLPTVRRCHVTAGVAKQANTSSVLLKWVRWGLATAWPRHCPHMRTCPLWVLAADVWLVWHAATSTTLVIRTELYVSPSWHVVLADLFWQHSANWHWERSANLSLSVFIRVGRAWLLLLPVPNWPYELAPQA